MLDGTVLKGTVKTAGNDLAEMPITGKLPDDSGQFYFECSNGEHSGMIRTDSVKVICVGAEAEVELHSGLRFFDSAPAPGFLWVRVGFPDGEILEGLVANEWASLSDSLIRLHLPSQRPGQKDVLIPRTSIRQLQVITTR